ncbi:MAG: hypothetical protein ACK4UU_00300, partial [Fimbriimonadales bacterium]
AEHSTQLRLKIRPKADSDLGEFGGMYHHSPLGEAEGGNRRRDATPRGSEFSRASSQRNATAVKVQELLFPSRIG